jgi:hypothetical protein
MQFQRVARLGNKNDQDTEQYKIKRHYCDNKDFQRQKAQKEEKAESKHKGKEHQDKERQGKNNLSVDSL